MISKKFLPALFALVLLSLPAGLYAQEGGIRQYQRQFMLGGRYNAAIILVGFSKDAADIEKLFDIVQSKAQAAYLELDWQNASGDVAKLIANAGSGGIKVKDDVLAAFEAFKKAAEWTEGRFDINYGEGSYKDISINHGSSTVELKKSGMQIKFDNMISGFLAELIARYIYAANMQNAIVKVGNVFRGIGQGIAGPWKIQVQDDAGTFAHHALNLTCSNTGVAAVSASQFRAAAPFDPKSKSQVQPSNRGVVAVMNDAALAEAIAYASFVSGTDDGFKILSKFAKGLLVSGGGQFMRTQGF